MSNDRAETIAVAVGATLGFFLQAWLLMLLLGGLHAEVSSSIPAVSYGGSVLLALAVNVLFGVRSAAR